MLEVDILDVKNINFWHKKCVNPSWGLHLFNPVEQWNKNHWTCCDLLGRMGVKIHDTQWRKTCQIAIGFQLQFSGIGLEVTVGVPISPTVSKISTRMMSACAIPGEYSITILHGDMMWHGYSLTGWTTCGRNSLQQNSWAQIPPVSSQVTGTHSQTTFDFISHGPGCSGPGADANGRKVRQLLPILKLPFSMGRFAGTLSSSQVFSGTFVRLWCFGAKKLPEASLEIAPSFGFLTCHVETLKEFTIGSAGVM